MTTREILDNSLDYGPGRKGNGHLLLRRSSTRSEAGDVEKLQGRRDEGCHRKYFPATEPYEKLMRTLYADNCFLERFSKVSAANGM